MKRTLELILIAFLVVGCSADNGLRPVGEEIVSGLIDEEGGAGPGDAEITLSPMGLEGLFGPDKIPSCFVFTTSDGYVFNIHLNHGSVVGTMTGPTGCQYELSGTGRAIVCTPLTGCCDLIYYVEGFDIPLRFAYGTVIADCFGIPGSGSFSGYGSRCP